MKKKSKIVALASVWTVSASVAILLPAGPAVAADRRGGDGAPSQYSMPGTNETPGTSQSTSNQANYQANYHADYHISGTGEAAKQVEEGQQPQQHDTIQRDWRSTLGVNRPGQAPATWPRSR